MSNEEKDPFADGPEVRLHTSTPLLWGSPGASFAIPVTTCDSSQPPYIVKGVSTHIATFTYSLCIPSPQVEEVGAAAQDDEAEVLSLLLLPSCSSQHMFSVVPHLSTDCVIFGEWGWNLHSISGNSILFC
jgi:hypothetical protein